jgi:hypothetical protein
MTTVALPLRGVLVPLFLSLAACGEAGGGGSGGQDPGSGGAGAGQGPSGSAVGFSLHMTDAREAVSLEGVAAPKGGFFVIATVAIANRTAATPVKVAPPLFELVTDGNLVVPSAPETAVLDDACSTIAVAAGGSLECSLAFGLPPGERPSVLKYEDPMTGRAAEAQFGMVTPACPPIATPFEGTSCHSCVDAEGCDLDGTFEYCYGTQAAQTCIAACEMSDDPCGCEATCHLAPHCQDAIAALRACEIARCPGDCG